MNRTDEMVTVRIGKKPHVAEVIEGDYDKLKKEEKLIAMEDELEIKTTMKSKEMGKKEVKGKKRGRKEKDKLTKKSKKPKSDFEIITIGSPAPPASPVLAQEDLDMTDISNISLFSQSTVHLNVSYSC
uniref:Uncharacterized protein n=1 Tax=Amphimedon queenslandica TaxID=400682 RepID=A0A1X7TDY5_AMPQE